MQSPPIFLLPICPYCGLPGLHGTVDACLAALTKVLTPLRLAASTAAAVKAAAALAVVVARDGQHEDPLDDLVAVLAALAAREDAG